MCFLKERPAVYVHFLGRLQVRVLEEMVRGRRGEGAGRGSMRFPRTEDGCIVPVIPIGLP